MQFPDDDFPDIHNYSRQDALEDGILIAAPEQVCREAGISYPVAFTRSLWDSVILPDAKSIAAGQSIQGRLRDTLFLFAFAARRTEGPVLTFIVRFLFHGDEHRDIELKSLCGHGDESEPVITIMSPGEY